MFMCVCVLEGNLVKKGKKKCIKRPEFPFGHHESGVAWMLLGRVMWMGFVVSG